MYLTGGSLTMRYRVSATVSTLLGKIFHAFYPLKIRILSPYSGIITPRRGQNDRIRHRQFQFVPQTCSNCSKSRIGLAKTLVLAASAKNSSQAEESMTFMSDPAHVALRCRSRAKSLARSWHHALERTLPAPHTPAPGSSAQAASPKKFEEGTARYHTARYPPS